MSAQHSIEHPTPRSNPWAPFATILAWYLLTFVLLPTPPVRESLDESWRAFLTWAFEHGRQFGVDVVFTYGPWGFLLEPRGTLSNYPWQVAGRLVLAVAASAGIAVLGTAWIGGKRQRWLWSAAIVALADLAVLAPLLLFLVTLPSVVLARGRTPALYLLAFAAGLAACTKFTCFLLVAALLPVLARKAHAFLIPVLLGSFGLFWIAAGQGLSHVPQFLRQALEVSRGYATSMAAGEPGAEVLVVIALCVLPLLWWSRHVSPASVVDRSSRLAWLTFFAFLNFRHSLIRNDTEHLFASLVLSAAPLAILLIPLPRKSATNSIWRDRGIYSYPVHVAILTVAAMASSGYSIIGRGLLYFDYLRLYPKLVRDLADAPVQASNAPDLRAEPSAVDVFPYDLSYAIRSRLPLRNRPVIQAYAAYSAKLTEQNAHFLEGPSAPRTIYFHTGAIDHRFPTMEDSLAWRSLLTHYKPAGFRDTFLVLEHRDRPFLVRQTPILQRQLKMGETLQVPDAAGTLIWAELEVHKTFVGKFLDTFYRREPLGLDVQTDRRTLALTLLDGTSSGGFLLSPYVDSKDAMLGLYGNPSATGETVQRLALRRGKMASFSYSDEVDLRLYSTVLSAP